MAEKINADNEMKGYVLNLVASGVHTTQEIADFLITKGYAGSLGSVRSEITYLKNSGYLTLGRKQSRPFRYYLTKQGEIHAENPHIKREYREQRIRDEIDARFEDDERFKKAVEEWAEQHELKKIHVNYQKAPIVRFNRAKTEKIVIENDDGTEQEVTTEELMNTLQDATIYLSRIAEMTNTIVSLQWEKAGYEQQIGDLYYALDERNISLESIKRKNTGAMRIAQRKDLIFMVSGYNPNELDGEYPVEIQIGADFFNAWGSIWGRKVKGATLFKRRSFELMADTNPEVTVRKHAQELSYDQMNNIGLFISKIRSSGITVDAYSDRMLKPKALVW
ncbi:MAG: hypothetical protein MUO76_12265 [Anaerolineaceae bacterium]|nr:hypothetical protein [Anaerolineaceae bacterium]